MSQMSFRTSAYSLTCRPSDTQDTHWKRHMPSTRLTTGTWVRGNEMKIIEAIQAALLSSLKLPDYDRDVVHDVYEANTRIVPTGRSDRYTRIEITMFSGRSMDAKRLLDRTLVANLSEMGVPANEIKMFLIEEPAENWACVAACQRPRSTLVSKLTSKGGHWTFW